METVNHEPPDPLRSKSTRAVRIGSVTIGGGHPIAVQSMAATGTSDVEATGAQVRLLAAAGAEVIRICRRYAARAPA